MCKHKPGTARCTGNSVAVSSATPSDQNPSMPIASSSACNKETVSSENMVPETSNIFHSSGNNNDSMCSKELMSVPLSDRNANSFISSLEQNNASTNIWYSSQETKTPDLKSADVGSHYKMTDGKSQISPMPLWSIREEKEGMDYSETEHDGRADLCTASTPDVPCGSEESLLPYSELSSPLRNKREHGIVSKVYLESPPLCLIGYDPAEIDLIRFSPSEYSSKDGNENEHLLSNRENGNCMFRCSGDDTGSDDEGNNVLDNDCDSLVIQNYNFTPIVTMISHENDNRQCATPAPDEASDLFLDVFFPKRLGLPQVKSAAEISVASSVSQKSLPICRICHLPASEDDTLISPCRCSGTMQYIHNGCLLKWLEICCKRSKRPPSCELCLYQYHRHKKFKVKHWELPQCSRRDKILHIIFVVSVIMMISCATATILCFKHDKGVRKSEDKTELTRSEIITLVCGVLFFIAFFVAMYVEVKSRNTLYKLLTSFLYLNQQWYIDEYDKKKDIQPVPV